MNQMVVMNQQYQQPPQQVLNDPPPLVLSINKNKTNNAMVILTPNYERGIDLYIRDGPEALMTFRGDVYAKVNVSEPVQRLLDGLFFKEQVLERYLNERLACFLLESKQIFADSLKNLYFWHNDHKLFTPLLLPINLSIYIGSVIDRCIIRYYHTFMIDLELFSKTDPYYQGPNRNVIYDTLSANYQAIFGLTKNITLVRCSAIFYRIKELLLLDEFKDNTVNWLTEEGAPLFVPTKDGQVIYIGPNRPGLQLGMPYDRTSCHAFTTRCKTMLSMQYTYQEIEDEVIKLTTALNSDDTDDCMESEDIDDYLEDLDYDYSEYSYNNSLYYEEEPEEEPEPEKEYKEVKYESKFGKLIHDIANDDDTVILQLYFFFGTILGGYSSKKVWHIYTQWKHSGKTALTKLIEYLLGSYTGFSPMALIIGKADAIHQSALGFTCGRRITIIDEAGRAEEYKINTELLKKISGGETTLTGRMAGPNQPEFKFGLTSELLILSNNRFYKHVDRLLEIQLKSAFTTDLNAEQHDESWYRDKVTKEELLDELKVPGAIKQAKEFFYEEIINNKEESLKFLALSIYYAAQRFNDPAGYDKLTKVSENNGSQIPPTLYDFMNCEIYCTENERKTVSNVRYDSLNGLPERENPYIYSVDDDTPLIKWVTSHNYYTTYCTYVLKHCNGTTPLSLQTFKEELRLLGLLDSDGYRVKFLANAPSTQADFRDILESNFEYLDSGRKKYHINQGITRSDVHKAVIAKVKEQNIIRVAQGLEKFNKVTAQNILSWITEFKSEWIKSSSRSGTHKYYHVKQKV